jgi:hypothetical protein
MYDLPAALLAYWSSKREFLSKVILWSADLYMEAIVKVHLFQIHLFSVGQ